MDQSDDSAVEDALCVFARTRPGGLTRAHRRQAGKRYEDYIGYLLESNHWDVTFQGARKGRLDGGIDLFGVKCGRTYAFQCKGWHALSEIEDWQILKFHRDLQKCPASGSIWRGVFVTSAQFTQAALAMGITTGIVLKRVPRSNDWPAIKCNVCPKTSARRYYLPDDPGYRSVKISLEQGDCYAHTEEEARSQNFH